MSGQLNNLQFFVCPHGFGHIRRVLNVVKNLVQKQPSLPIGIHVKNTHLSAFQPLLPEWGHDSQAMPQITWITETMTDCPDFSGAEYPEAAYEKWTDNLQACMEKHKDSLVVSDNLVAPAFYSEHGVLMGSFLWSSVISSDYLPTYQAIAAREKAMLKDRKPDMLALEDMAMPDVRQLTNIVALPWFCEKGSAQNAKSDDSCRVLLSVGGTPKSMQKGLELLNLLHSGQYIIWYLDRRLFEASGAAQPNIRLFDFSEQAFGQLDLVIARPGIGILTDCITWNIPVIAIGESFNAELMHNAATVEAKGWGWNWLEKPPLQMRSEFEDLLAGKKLETAKSQLTRAVCGGIPKAADALLARLNPEQH